MGVLGGTFDPIHYGHLRPAEEVRDALCLSELRLIPARMPPHRAPPARPPEVRTGLVRAAVADDPHCVVDERELRRAGPSFTVDTLRELRAERPEAALCLILGWDSYRSLPLWSRWRELTDHAHLIVTTRPRASTALPAELEAWHGQRWVSGAGVQEALRAQSAGVVVLFPVTPLDISATAIRQDLACGRSVRHLMPEAARRQAAAEGLYGYPQL